MEPKRARHTQEGHHYLALQMLCGDAERRAAAADTSGHPDIAKTYRRIASHIATIPAPKPPRREVPGQTDIYAQIHDLEDHRPTEPIPHYKNLREYQDHLDRINATTREAAVDDHLDRLLDRWEDCAIPSACKHRDHRLRHDELGPIFEGLT